MSNEPSGEAPDVSISGSHGIQVGQGNVQNNTWVSKQPLDPAFLRGLSPHSGAERIRQLPHDDAVDLLAKTPPQDAVGALKTLLAVDEAKTVAVLADLSPGKAAELIEPLAEQAPWLESLPGAAVATAEYAMGLLWEQRVQIGPLEHMSSGGTEGYMRDCGSRRIYWSAVHGVLMVTGKINELHATDVEYFGFPISAERVARKSPGGTQGTLQEFESVTIFASGVGTYGVALDFGMTSYANLGGSGGRLGFPRSGHNTLRYFMVQLFEGGVVSGTGSIEDDSHAVFTEVGEYLDQLGGLERWLPVDDETIGRESATRDPYKLQNFEDPEGSKLTVYSSKEHGIHGVHGGIKTYYDGIGGAACWLGLPVDETVELSPGLRQRFEFGTIFDRRGHETLSVPSETVELYSRDRKISERLGWPVSEEKPVDDDERVQFFQNGVVAERDGRREVSLRPDATPAPVEPASRKSGWSSFPR